ncbi:MAG: Gfo/Idh/MocA family oxidoreductase [Planctomycetota bacterium]
MSDRVEDDPRALKAAEVANVEAPDLEYLPPRPQSWRPRIGLVGCGGISATQLDAYRKHGFEVAALCSRDPSAAEARRAEYFPAARVTTDEGDLFGDPTLDVIDFATPAGHRAEAIPHAIDAGKHVLSQKPFVTDLDVGESLVERAATRRVTLAVNQNGRWAPYFAYLRAAADAGLLGEIRSVDVQIAWDHRWIDETDFVRVPHVVLYDFGIHWFDMIACLFGGRLGGRVFAAVSADATRGDKPPLSAHAVLDGPGVAASLTLRAATAHGPEESVTVVGTEGTFRSRGPVCGAGEITLTSAAGRAVKTLEGQWFPDGFAGAMGEMLAAIELSREPVNAARGNLAGLGLCFAAVASAERGGPVEIGSVRRLDPAWVRRDG